MSMKKNSRPVSQGFSAVELLVALVVAAVFLFGGFNFYNTIANFSVESRGRSNADRIAYDYLRRYESTIGPTCAASTPLNQQALTDDANVDGLSQPTITVIISCPLSAVPTLSKIIARVEYVDGVDTLFVEQEVYASQ